LDAGGCVQFKRNVGIYNSAIGCGSRWAWDRSSGGRLVRAA